MERNAKAQRMQDILDQLRDCYDEWKIADPHHERYLTAAIERHLIELRRLCADTANRVPYSRELAYA